MGQDLLRCERCGSIEDVSLEPSVSQLIFGGFNFRLERRCEKCECRVARYIQGILDDLDSVSPGAFSLAFLAFWALAAPGSALI